MSPSFLHTTNQGVQRVPMKDVKLEPLLNDKELEQIQILLSGSLLRPGERILVLILLDLAHRTQEQNDLLKQLIDGNLTKKDRPQIK